MKSIWSAVIALAAWTSGVLLVAPAANAQDYVIGPADVLQISIWRHPELERSVTVGADGNIVFAPIGSIKASGLSASELGGRLGDRLSAYLRETVSATVTITQFVSQGVFVSGSVAHPGRYGFERIPGLLDAINYAGGALPDADLRRVQILRLEGGTRQVMAVDLSAALMRGSEAGLPELQAGDIVVVPSAAAIGGASTVDAAGVLGEVLHPGLYPVGVEMELWWVLAQAGGPTERGNLSSVRVLRKSQDPGKALSVNLRKTLDNGNREPFMIRPGDIVYINPRGVSVWDGFLTVLGVTRDVASLVAIVDVLRKN